MHTKNHPYHIVELSPWPILTCLALLCITTSTVAFMHNAAFALPAVFVSAIFLISCTVLWWRDVLREAIVEKQHNDVVRKGFKLGFILFIISEVAFFGVFFFSIIWNKLLPLKGLEAGSDIWHDKVVSWVPTNWVMFDPWNLPFTNTLILMLSGTTLTWAHYELKKHNKEKTLKALKLTILLGIAFTGIQIFEYIHAPFKMPQSVFTSDFYISTGFHGAHVLIGTIFLIVCYFRTALGHFDAGKSHSSFIFAAWYWQFVDIVWIGLFVFLYLWT